MENFGVIVSFGILIIVFAAWITHIYVTIMAANWSLLIVGAIFIPIGVVHGIGIWFDSSWMREE